MDPGDIAVPHCLDEVFGKRKAMGVLVDKFLYLRAKLNALRNEPCAAKLDYEELCLHLDHIQLILSNAIPYAQCACQSHPCLICKGTKWMSSGEFLAAKLSRLRSDSKACFRKSPWHNTFPAQRSLSQDLISKQTRMCMKLLQDSELQNESPLCGLEHTLLSGETSSPTNGRQQDSPTEP